jgi:hypothetical protein
MNDCSINRRVSDGGVLEFTRFYEGLGNHILHITSELKPDNSQPFVFVGGEAFAPHLDFLKLFSLVQLVLRPQYSTTGYPEQGL